MTTRKTRSKNTTPNPPPAESTEPKKTVIQEVRFKNAGPPEGFVEDPNTPGVHVSPQYQAWMKEQLGIRVAEMQAESEIDPEVKALAEELAVVHLPEYVNGQGRKLAEPDRFEILQAQRLAEYLVKGRGVRVHPDLETLRWVPTPGGHPHDLGLHIERDENGDWPAPDPEDFFDLDKIVVAQSENGWVASHPSGVAVQEETKSKAKAGAVAELMKRIEEAKENG